MTEQAANGAASTLAVAMLSGDLSLTIEPGDTAKFPSVGTFALTIMDNVNGWEIVEVGVVGGTVFSSLTRASEVIAGVQTAFAHPIGTPVGNWPTAGTLAALAATAVTGPTGPTGPIGMIWLGAWSSATAYVASDGVSLGGASYICILAHTNHTPPNATYWGLIASAGTAGTPATAVVGPDAFGAAAVVGSNTNYARQDHDHGLPANPAPLAATTTTGPDSYGASAVVGTGTHFARNDHDHGLPAAPSSYPLSTPQGGQLSSGLALSASTLTVVFTSPSLAVGTWRVTFGAETIGPGTWNLEISLAVGTASATFKGQQSAGTEESYGPGPSLTCLVVITAAGTLVFNAETNGGGQVIPATTPTFGFPGATGWTATRVA
jgi:hypothetical protein